MILKLDKQVTSLEISKKLFDLGVRQDSLYFHSIFLDANKDRVKGIISQQEIDSLLFSSVAVIIEKYAAYTVDELLFLLKKYFKVLKGGIYFRQQFTSERLFIEFRNEYLSIIYGDFYVDILGQFLELSIKEGDIKVEDL